MAPRPFPRGAIAVLAGVFLLLLVNLGLSYQSLRALGESARKAEPRLEGVDSAYSIASLTGYAASAMALAGIGLSLWLLVRHQNERDRALRILEKERGESDRLAAMIETFIASAPVGLAFVDRDFRYIRINESLASINGLPASEHLGRTVPEIVPSIWPQLEPVFRSVLDTGESVLGVELSGKSQWKESDELTVIANFFPVRLAGDEVACVGIAVLDITARKLAEQSLHESERRRRVAQRSGSVGVWFWELPSGKLTCEPELEALYGVPPGTFRTYDEWAPYIHAEDLARGAAARDSALAAGKPFSEEFRIRHASGEERWLLAKGHGEYDASGKLVGAFGVNIDITDRKRVEQSLRETNERLMRAQQAARLGTWDIDQTTGRVEWSDGMYMLLGLEVRSVQPDSRMWSTFILPDDLDAMRPVLAQLRETGGPFTIEFRVRRTDGAILWIASIGRMEMSPDGKPLRMLGVNIDITERKRVQLALQASETRYRMATEAMSGMVYDFDRITGRVERSAGLLSVVGYRPDESEPTQEWWSNRIHPDDLQIAKNRFRQAEAAGDATLEAEYRVKHRDGSERHVWDRAVLERGPDGKVVRMVGYTLDITERNRAELSLRESEERFRLLATAANDGFWEIDVVSGKVWWNESYDRMFGPRPAESTSSTDWWSERIHPEDRERVQRAFESSLMSDSERWVQEYRFRRRDGSYAYVVDRAFVSRDAKGRPLRIAGSMLDLTERKRTEEALRESEALFRTLGEAVPDFLWMTDAEGRPLYQNPAWRNFTGMTPEQFAEKGWEALHAPEDVPLLKAEWEKAVAAGQAIKVETRFRRHDGEFRWFSGRTIPLHDDTGRVVKWVGTMTDIHELKLAEAALRDADRRKNEFLATLAHELRNPLAPIRNAVHLLMLKGPPDPPLQAAREMIERQVKHMVRLIDDLLDVSRITRGRLELRRENVTLGLILDQAIETSRPHLDRARHELTMTLPETTVWVHADSVRMSQVFANLLHNACKYMEPGGRIVVRAEVVGNEAVVSITDTGIGIAPDHLPRLFEMFSQVASALDRSQGGLGIGLSLAKGLVEMHGGRIEARSEGIGRGTTFCVRLPIASMHAGLPALSTNGHSHEPTSLRILVVDDNRDAALSLASLLELKGHRTAVAFDGADALDQARRFHPDAAILDLGLPGMNGFELCRRLRQDFASPRMFITALSGWGQDDDRRRSREAGFDAHLVKPVEYEALSKLLYDAVRTRTPSSAP
jgi:PAS domain S-box-containing protein